MTRSAISLILRLFLLLIALGGPAFAQAPPKDPEGFEPVDGSMMQTGESLPASRLVATAYGLIFAYVTFYAVSVALRTRKVEQELDELRRRLDKGK